MTFFSITTTAAAAVDLYVTRVVGSNERFVCISSAKRIKKIDKHFSYSEKK